MLEIKNHQEAVEQLTGILMQFDKDMNSYQTDVYMYFDNETQTVSLDTFVNVGGNSWLDDDHINIYSDKEHYESYDSFFSEIGDIAAVLEIPYEQLCEETLIYQGFDISEIDETAAVNYSEVWDYVTHETEKGLNDKLFLAYCDHIDETKGDYFQIADEILDVELKYYGCECNRDNDKEIVLIEYLEDSEKNVDKLNGYLEDYNAVHKVSLGEIRDKVKSENLIVDGHINNYKLEKSIER